MGVGEAGTVVGGRVEDAVVAGGVSDAAGTVAFPPQETNKMEPTRRRKRRKLR